MFGAAAAWLIEQMTGAISWAIVRVGQGVIQVTLDFLDEIEWGDPPDWAVFGSSFLEIASESGAIAALGILVAVELFVLWFALSPLVGFDGRRCWMWGCCATRTL